MRTQTTVSLLTAAALVLASTTVMAQGRHGQGGAQPVQRAQIERGQKDFDRDRLRDRDRITNPAQDRDRLRDQDRTHAPDRAPFGEKAGNGGNGNGDGIYGSGLMSEQERNQYREQLRLTESDPQARTKLMAQHKEEMQKRARAQGVELRDPPEAEEAE